MSYIDLTVERQIAEAIARGEMDGGALKGKPLPDADEMRPPGWWGEQLMRRERSRVLQEDSLPELATWRRRFWRAADTAELRRRLTEANRWVAGINGRLLREDALALVDPAEVAETWRRNRVS